MLPVPSYIDVSSLRLQPKDFVWDDGVPHGVLEDLDKKSARGLRGASDLAKVAFVIACAEWVVYRFAPESTIDFAWEYIEASWAKLIDPVVARTWEPTDWVFVGRADGSIATALHSITNTFYGIDEGGGWVQEIPLASSFAEHVLGEFPGFVKWRANVVPHLVRHFPSDRNGGFGPPVPRIAVDPSVEPDERHLADAMQGVSELVAAGTNRFLTSPEEQEQMRATMEDDEDE